MTTNEKGIFENFLDACERELVKPEYVIFGLRNLIAKAIIAYPKACSSWELDLDINLGGGLCRCENCWRRERCLTMKFKKEFLGVKQE